MDCSEQRRGVLLAIRDQGRLARGVAFSKGSPPDAWSPQQWWQAFDYLLVQNSSSNSSGGSRDPGEPATDDLLFFVTAPGAVARPRGEAYFVRRKSAKHLPADLQLSGERFDKVDWQASVLLNIVLQGQFSLTVVTCGREALPFVAEGRTWSPNTATVTKPVYASPTVTAVNLDDSRAGDAQPAPCYPDICFAVDNFSNAFDSMVLQELDNCYCVVLHALLDTYGEGGGGGGGGGGSSGGAAAAAAAAAVVGPAGGGADGGGGSADPQSPNLAVLAARLAAGGGSGSAANRQGGAGAAGMPGEARQGDSPRTAGLPDAAKLAGRLQGAGLLGSPRAAAGVAAASGAAPPGGEQPPGLPAISTTGDGGAAAAVAAAHSSPSAASGSPGGWQIGTRKRTLFAGYVAFGQILDFMAHSASRRRGGDAGGGGGLLGGLFGGGGGGGPQRDKVVMTGPGGTGRAEVAVTKLVRPVTPRVSGDGAAPPLPPPQQQQQGAGAGRGLLRAARQLASGLQQALADMNDGGGDARCNMQCALMQLKLPVSYLAQELLEAV